MLSRGRKWLGLVVSERAPKAGGVLPGVRKRTHLGLCTGSVGAKPFDQTSEPILVIQIAIEFLRRSWMLGSNLTSAVDERPLKRVYPRATEQSSRKNFGMPLEDRAAVQQPCW